MKQSSRKVRRRGNASSKVRKLDKACSKERTGGRACSDVRREDMVCGKERRGGNPRVVQYSDKFMHSNVLYYIQITID